MHKIPSPPQAFFDESGVNADDRVWDYGRACYALALSRGVPEGTWLWGKLMDWCRSQGTSPANFDSLFAIASEAHKLYAAPAAAGAQGEEYAACCDTPAYCSSVRRCTRMDATPQPAAADGGVRERAREILAGEVASDYPKMARALVAGKSVESYVLVPHCLRAIEAALSSHRQAGDVDVESAARALFEAQADPHAAPWDHQWDRTKQYWRRIARGNLYTATPPGADLSKQVASVCLVTERRLPHFASVEVQLYDGYEPKIGDRLALVEKGAGNGQ